MEMNTRIQVEHPVTEMVTGLDLIKMQILLAAGEKLPNKLNRYKLRGHAIECRINAEDPDNNFRPSPGLISSFHIPCGPGVRVDTHAYAQYRIPPYYDSLIAKVITHGKDRSEAVLRMQRALEECIVEGVSTTIPLLLRILRDDRFSSGNYNTKFMENFITSKGSGQTPIRIPAGGENSTPLRQRKIHSGQTDTSRRLIMQVRKICGIPRNTNGSRLRAK